MKAIKIIVQILIIAIPFTLQTLDFVCNYKLQFWNLYNFLLSAYLLGQFGYFADSFGKWFDSKLK